MCHFLKPNQKLMHSYSMYVAFMENNMELCYFLLNYTFSNRLRPTYFFNKKFPLICTFDFISINPKIYNLAVEVGRGGFRSFVAANIFLIKETVMPFSVVTVFLLTSWFGYKKALMCKFV